MTSPAANPDKENEDPHNHSRPRSPNTPTNQDNDPRKAKQAAKHSKRHALRKALNVANEQVADQRRQLKEQSMEIEKLKADCRQDSATNSNKDREDGGPSKKVKRSSTDQGSVKTDALRAGKRLAICDLLWIEPMALSYVAIQGGNEAADELAELEDDEENEEELERARTQAQLIYEKLPVQLRDHVGTRWFQQRFNEGMKAIRSQQIHSLADLFPVFVFPEIPPVPFANRSKRSAIPEVANLLEGNRFLYDRKPDTPQNRRNGHMRNSGILKILLCVLHGPSAVKQGSRSTRSRKVNGDLWGVKKTTIHMLAFAATAALFILSGEAEFTERGVEHSFQQFYQTRVDILTKESQKTRNRHFTELMGYYDRHLFPDDEEDNLKHLSAEERELLQAIDEAEDSDNANEEGNGEGNKDHGEVGASKGGNGEGNDEHGEVGENGEKRAGDNEENGEVGENGENGEGDNEENGEVGEKEGDGQGGERGN